MASEPVRSCESVKFGQDFELELRFHRLRRAGRLIKLERIPLEILVLLVERAGEIVTRKEIVARIWGENVFLDTDNSINGAIRKIRQVLRDDSDQPRFIETVSGRGYRFIAPVLDVIPPHQAPERVPDPATRPVADPKPEPRSTHTRLYAAIAIPVVLLISALVYLRWHRPAAPPASNKVMLAVLPFANLTGDSTQEYFSDGLTEEMIARLGDLNPQRLGVIARTSVMSYKQTNPNLTQIGHDLGVQYVLEGSVRKDASGVRVTAQLIQLSDGTHLWAKQYDRQLTNIIGLQDEIAHEIAQEIQVTLVGEHARDRDSAPNLSPEQFASYDLYLQGRYFWNKRTPEGFHQAINSFNRALEKDPLNARAQAGLADSYVLLSGYGLMAPSDAFPRARAAALRAIDLDDRLAEAHTSLGAIYLFYDWNWQAAEKEYQRAIALDPNYSTAHHWYAELLALQGRFDEAFASSERARRLDPLSLIIATDHAVWLLDARQHDRAIEQFKKVMATNPNFPRVHMIEYAYVEKGRFEDAINDMRSWRRFDQSPWTWAMEAYIYGRSQRHAKAQKALPELINRTRNVSSDPDPMLVIAYIGVDNKEKALQLLEKGVDQHKSYVTGLKVEPIYDPLRGDLRFQALLKRISLSE